MAIHKFVSHRIAWQIAKEFGWLPGARYTNLRDVRAAPKLGFLDIDWKNYSYSKHLDAASKTRPFITVARDVVDIRELDRTLEEAEALRKYCEHVVVVPKDPRLAGKIDTLIPLHFLIGYSVPTRYGGTTIHPKYIDRPVHLLGGRPDRQRILANQLSVFSMDCNRFTLDATFGDYFDGQQFRSHPIGGYTQCLRDSIKHITKIWDDYPPPDSSVRKKNAIS
ncbi:MAG: DUF6610 family protein [Meiothermus sp.]|nr:DUF6610 family protein [Meiothermus sp.]